MISFTSDHFSAKHEVKTSITGSDSLHVSAETILNIQHLKIKVRPLENDILCIDFLKAIKFIIEITSSFRANSAYVCKAE